MSHRVPNIPAEHIIPQATRAAKEWIQKAISAINGLDTDLDGKASIIAGATPGNFAFFTDGGDLTDNGKTPPTGAVVGTTDAQTLTNKTLTQPAIEDFTLANHDHGDGDDGGDLGGVDGDIEFITAIRYLASGGVQYKTQTVKFRNGGMLTEVGSISSWTTAASV